MSKTFKSGDKMKAINDNFMPSDRLSVTSSASANMLSKRSIICNEETSVATLICEANTSNDETKQKREKSRHTLFKKRRFNDLDFNQMGDDNTSLENNANLFTSRNNEPQKEIEEKVSSLEDDASQKNNHRNSPGNSRKQKAVKKNKKSKVQKDKRPKHPMNAYNFFFREERKKIVSGEAIPSPNERLDALGSMNQKTTNFNVNDSEITFEEIGKIIGKRWKQVSEEDLERYTSCAAEDLERYRNEMQEFRAAKIFEQKAEKEAETDKNKTATGVTNQSEVDVNQEIINEILKSSLGLGQARDTMQRQQPINTDSFTNSLSRPEILHNGANLLPNIPPTIGSLQQFLNPALIASLPQRSDFNRGPLVFPALNPTTSINTASQMQQSLQSLSLPSHANHPTLLNTLNHQQVLQTLQLQQIQSQQQINPVSLLYQLHPASQEIEFIQALRNVLSRNGT